MEEEEEATQDEQFEIRRTAGRLLRFRGERLAHVSEHSHQGSTQNRWYEFCLYRTTGGRYVLEQDYFTQWQGESNSITARVLDTIPDVIAALAFESGEVTGALELELLEKAGIEYSEEVE